MAKYTKLTEVKPHPAVWMRIAHSLHWGVDLDTLLKETKISQKDWEDNAKWVQDAYQKTAHYKSGKYEDPVFDPFEEGFSLSKVPAYTE